MRNKKYVREIAEILQEAESILASKEDSKFHYKVTVVSLVLHGMPIKEVVKNTKVGIRTIQEWVKIADEQGCNALRPKKSPGRARSLNQAQEAEVKQAVLSDPEEYGYCVWEGKTVAAWIQKQFGITISVRACQYLLKRLGFSRIRPQTYPNHQKNQEPREEYKKN